MQCLPAIRRLSCHCFEMNECFIAAGDTVSFVVKTMSIADRLQCAHNQQKENVQLFSEKIWKIRVRDFCHGQNFCFPFDTGIARDNPNDCLQEKDIQECAVWLVCVWYIFFYSTKRMKISWKTIYIKNFHD